jgi:hypothetical protein
MIEKKYYNLKTDIQGEVKNLYNTPDYTFPKYMDFDEY